MTKFIATVLLAVAVLFGTSSAAVAQDYSIPLPADAGASAEEILAAIQANNEAAAAAIGDEGDEVLGITQVPGDGLALTGSEVSTPIALGAGLLAAGSVMLLAARRRQD